MHGSPTIRNTLKHFSLIKDALDPKSTRHSYTLAALYPIIVLIILLVKKPNFILVDDYTSSTPSISYQKLILWLIIFQIPLLYYVL
uniref:Uncharacterized protein n=1 Tax=viral metagenome TaxID=1070528 RepID=A0A6C0KCB6_9ZZZZ